MSSKASVSKNVRGEKKTNRSCTKLTGSSRVLRQQLKKSYYKQTHVFVFFCTWEDTCVLSWLTGNYHLGSLSLSVPAQQQQEATDILISRAENILIICLITGSEGWKFEAVSPSLFLTQYARNHPLVWARFLISSCIHLIFIWYL